MNKEYLDSAFPYMFTIIHPSNISIPKGWENLIFHLLLLIDQIDTNKYIRILQIKSKFAGLRFYFEWTEVRNITLHDRLVNLVRKFPWFIRKYLIKLGLPQFRKISPTHEKLYNIIREFENISFNICESCGMPGNKRHSDSRIYTLCDKCWYELESTNVFEKILREEILLGSGHLQPQDL